MTLQRRGRPRSSLARLGCSTAALLALLAVAGAATGSEARYGGTLVVGLSRGGPDALDPTISRTYTAVEIYETFCQRLYEPVFDHGQIVEYPVLAASAPVLSRDRRSYTVHLRQGVLFNDGTPLDASAVVTSADRFMTYPGSSRASDFADISSVTASGRYTVVFHLNVPHSTLIAQNMYVLSPTALAKEGSAFAADPVCVGPFTFDQWVVGDSVTLVKSHYYWDQNDVFLDKIVFRSMPDAAAAAAALQAGDIQALDGISPPLLPTLQADSAIHIVRRNGLGWSGMFVNIGNKNGVETPFSNVGTVLSSSPSLRKAFEEAIDRAALIRVVFDGVAQSSCTPIPPANTPWFAGTSVPCTPYDPVDARKLVAASGIPRPTVQLTTANDTTDLAVAQFVQSEEAAVGITVVIDAADNATTQSLAAEGKYDVLLSGRCCDFDPNNTLLQYFETTGARNYSGYSNPRLDEVLVNGLGSATMKSRIVDYHVAQQIIAADRPIIVLYGPVQEEGWSTSVAGVEVSPGSELLVANAHER